MLSFIPSLPNLLNNFILFSSSTYPLRTSDDFDRVGGICWPDKPWRQSQLCDDPAAAELGLHIGDIRKLKVSDIDWDRKMITIVQNKTQKELYLPLPESVGWVLIDYIKNGQPISNSNYVFVKLRPTYDEFPLLRPWTISWQRFWSRQNLLQCRIHNLIFLRTFSFDRWKTTPMFF